MTPDPHFQTLHHPNPQALRDLLNSLFPLIAHLVQSNSGTREDAEDVFMYGMGELFFKAQQGTLRQNAKLSTILYAICRNYWLKTLKKNKPTAELTIDLENVYIDENQDDDERWERIQLVRRQMTRISKTCRELLELAFHTDLSMQQIAKKMNLSYGSARVRKSECLARLRALVEKAVAQNALND